MIKDVSSSIIEHLTCKSTVWLNFQAEGDLHCIPDRLRSIPGHVTRHHKCGGVYDFSRKYRSVYRRLFHICA